MIGVVYLSQSQVEFSEQDLSQLVQHATQKNRDLEVTGYLCYFRERFLQYIEGEADSVRALMNEIRKDTRHRVLYEIESDEISQRLFASWSMKHITKEELRGYNIELNLENNLIFLHQDFARKEKFAELLWKNVALISKHKNLIERHSHYSQN